MQGLAVVTGGARGIGRAVCETLATAGYDVVVVDINPAGAALAEAIGGVFFQADVSRESDVAQLAEYCGELGPVRVLVSNAGRFIQKPLAQVSLQAWDQILRTNLTASFLLAREFQSLLAPMSSMVLIASTRAHQSEPHTEAYAASKGGLVALGHALAVSMGPRTRVNVVSPGWIDTRETSLSDRDHEQHPAGRVGRPEDVAQMVAYLASHTSGFATGGEYVIDGGMSRRMIYHEA